MREIKVVIGKNFGDEGKGAAVAGFCQGGDALVVRHNGGAQAGHTVEEGKFRFVFHQLGSSSHLGCPTYWSTTFMPDLLKLSDEAEDLVAEEVRAGRQVFRPVVYADEGCACATIYDVLLNSLTESLRGGGKHGSCGMGIYETKVRSEEERYALRLRDFKGADVQRIAERLRVIREEYVERCLTKLRAEFRGFMSQTHNMQELNVGEHADIIGQANEPASSNHMKYSEIQEWIELIHDDNVLWNAAYAMYENFNRYVKLVERQELWKKYETIVFENAQGLMLDEDNEAYYPHLTPSHTGLHNVAELLADMDCTAEPFMLEVAYITRTYVTRHGAGRLDYECTAREIGKNIVDMTNIPNPWQDALRYAFHPSGAEFWTAMRQDLKELEKVDQLVRSERTDEFEQVKQHVEGMNLFRVSLYVTHLDETEEQMLFADGRMGLAQFGKICDTEGVKFVPVIHETHPIDKRK